MSDYPASLGRLLFRPLPPAPAAVASLIAALVIAPSPVAAIAYMADGEHRALAAYGVCIGFGIPAYAVLVWRRWLRWWHYLSAGIAASTVAALVWVASLFADSSNAHSLQYVALFATGTVFVAWLPGSLVALLAWLFLRRGSPILAAAVRRENAT